MNEFTKNRIVDIEHFPQTFVYETFKPINRVMRLAEMYEFEITPRLDYERDVLKQLEFIQEQLEYDITTGMNILLGGLTRMIAGECK